MITTASTTFASTAFASFLRRLIASVPTVTLATMAAGIGVNAAASAKASAAPGENPTAPRHASGDAPEPRFSVFFEGDNVGLDLASREVVALVTGELAERKPCFVDVIVDPDNRGLSWNVRAWKRAAAINAALRQAGLPGSVSLAVMVRDPRQGAALADGAPRDGAKRRLEIVIRTSPVADALSHDIRE